MKSLPVYCILYSMVDADRALFPDPEIRGCYLSLSEAQKEMERLIEEEKAKLDDRYDCEERYGDHWEMYQDGYAASLSSRIEILASDLCLGRECLDAYFGCGASAETGCKGD